jgi:hypothetical protein
MPDLLDEEVEVPARIFRLVTAVNDPVRQRFFAPGSSWWLASPNSRAASGALLLEEQIGLKSGTFTTLFGEKWKSMVGKTHPFLEFELRRFSNAMYITVKCVMFQNYGDPTCTPLDAGAIVMAKFCLSGNFCDKR